MSIDPPSDHDATEPPARLAYGVEALSAAWCQLPPPAKLLAWRLLWRSLHRPYVAPPTASPSSRRN